MNNSINFKLPKINIGIIGYGIVGKATHHAFSIKSNIYINDIKLDSSYSKQKIIADCKFIFLAIPTPFKISENKTDTRNIENVLRELNEYAMELSTKNIIIIKSALVPRVISECIKNFKAIDIVVSPEYLTERNSYHDFINQKVMILGGDKLICEEVVNLYEKYSICNKQVKIGICKAEEAALIKYMENCFLGMKNIFNNQFKLYYDKFFNIKDKHEYFNNLMGVFYLDERMGLYPFKYRIPGPDGDFGYGGKCLPKDIKTMISEADQLGIDLTIMKEVNKYNDKIRTNKDWLEIKGAIEK